MKKKIDVPFKIISTEYLSFQSGIHEWSQMLLDYRAITEFHLRQVNILPKGDEFEVGESQRLPEQTSKIEKYYIEALVNTCKGASDYEEMMMNLLHDDKALFHQTSKIVDLAINTIISALEASGHIEDETYSEKQRKSASSKYADALTITKKKGYKLLSLTDDDGYNPSYDDVANYLLDYFYKVFSSDTNKIPDLKLVKKWLKDEVPISHNPKLGNKSKDYIEFFDRVKVN